MGWDDLEPGQDDLVKDSKASKKIVKKAKKISSRSDDIYTDHNAGDPSSFIPKAEQDGEPARRSGGSPVASSLPQKLGRAVSSVGEIFVEAKRSIDQARRNKGTRGS